MTDNLPLDAGVPPPIPPRRASVRFMLAHPAHAISLAFGAGLSPWAPGTVGTAWAWLAFVVFDPWLGDLAWAGVIAASALIGWWACTVTARHLGTADPSCVVWDEVVAFWIVLWLLLPAGVAAQLVAFVLFRALDAAKPGPVGWADGLFKRRRFAGAVGWPQGFGILFDDLVAALCTLLPIALWRFIAG